jgi:hypothetical protein
MKTPLRSFLLAALLAVTANATPYMVVNLTQLNADVTIEIQLWNPPANGVQWSVYVDDTFIGSSGNFYMVPTPQEYGGDIWLYGTVQPPISFYSVGHHEVSGWITTLTDQVGFGVSSDGYTISTVPDSGRSLLFVIMGMVGLLGVYARRAKNGSA